MIFPSKVEMSCNCSQSSSKKKCWQSRGVLKARSSQDSVLVHHIRVKCPYNAFCYVYLSVPRFIFFWVMTESGEFCRDSI